ncbi:hypothetical protein GGI07_000182 [Coemansia sp. Benny D115]|nr:hypothetical protein GGI07_000182 [Coemansia sp. Benny D115]
MSHSIEPGGNAFAFDEDDNTQLQLLQAVPLHLDNLYPPTSTGVLAPQSVPSPAHPSGALLPSESEPERLARHVESVARSGLYTLQSQPDTCIHWRLLGDRSTLELRTLRWVGSGRDEEASATSAWRFEQQLLNSVVIGDDNDGRVSIVVCSRDGIAYRLRFDSAWAVAGSASAAECASWYRLTHGISPLFIDGSGAADTVAIAYADATVVWLEWRADGSVNERACSGSGSTTILPRMAAFLLGRSSSEDHAPVALAVGSLESESCLGATLGRDRRLRLWDSSHCVFDEIQPQLDVTGSPILSEGAQVPIEGRARINIVAAPHGAYIAVFVVDDATPYFALLSAQLEAGRWAVNTVLRKVCRAANGASALMADDELVDMQLAQDRGLWSLWALWDRAGDSVVTQTKLAVDSDSTAFPPERWVAVLQPPLSLRPTAGGPRIAEIDVKIRSEDDCSTSADIARAFLDHVLHPTRFSRAVLAHALHLYSASADASSGSGSGSGSVAMHGSLRRRIAATIESSQKLASIDSRSVILRRLFTEWMRFLALCVRLQQAANTPSSLSLCSSTQMVCIVGSSTLSLLQAAAEPECLHSLTQGDSAAGILLSAPTTSLVSAYPTLAQPHMRSEVANVLASSSSLVSNLPLARLTALAEALARDACSGEALVSREARVVELFEAHCADAITTKNIQHAARILRRCRDPSAAIRAVLQALVQGRTESADSEDAFGASSTMAGLFVSAFAISATARFEVARNIILLLAVAVACPGELPISDVPAALAASVHVLGLFTLPQWLAAQSTDHSGSDATVLLEDSDADAGFLRKFSVLNIDRARGDPSMAVESTSFETAFSYSLLHDTLARIYFLRFSGSTGAFCDMMFEGVQQIYGILEQDMQFAASVEKTQAPEITDTMLRLLPKTPATCYLAGLVSLRLRDSAVASDLFANAAIAYAQVTDGLRDSVDLQLVLPTEVLEAAHASAYFEHVADLFDRGKYFSAAARFGHLALQALEEDTEDIAPKVVKERRQRLWFKVFHSEIERNAYESAYIAVMAQPDQSLQLDCLRHFVSVLCERDQGVPVLCRLAFPGLQEEIERNLLFKARHSNLLQSKPNYYRILYSFHIYRGNYRNAASAMYQYARRLGTLMRASGDVAQILAEQGQALLACINGLSLVDQQYAWVIVGRQPGGSPEAATEDEADLVASGSGSESSSSKRRRIAIDRYDVVAAGQPKESQDIVVVELADIRREYALIMARITLGTTFSELFSRNVLLEPEDVVALYLKTAQYDRAMSISRMFELKLDTVFAALVNKCVQLSKIRDVAEGEELVPEAFYSNTGLPGSGPLVERCWRLLQYHLDAEEPSAGSSTRYRLLVAEAVLKAEYDSPLAPWISTPLLQKCPQNLVRLCLRNGCVTEGAEFLLQHINVVAGRLAQSAGGVRVTRELWLPYQLIDQTKGILDESVERFEEAVDRIKKARKEAPEQKKLRGLLKSYKDRLSGLRRLRDDLQKAFDQYIDLADRESRDITQQGMADSAIPVN